MLAFLGIAQRPYDIGRALTTTIIPLLAINPVLSLAAFTVLAPLQRRLNEQERFARG